MKLALKKDTELIFAIIFIILNVIYIFWLISLIIEDIRSGTCEGNGIEMLVLFPYFIELISLISLGGYIIYQIVTRKLKYNNKFVLVLVILYLVQVVIFNVFCLCKTLVNN